MQGFEYQGMDDQPIKHVLFFVLYRQGCGTACFGLQIILPFMIYYFSPTSLGKDVDLSVLFNPFDVSFFFACLFHDMS